MTHISKLEDVPPCGIERIISALPPNGLERFSVTLFHDQLRTYGELDLHITYPLS